MKLFYWAIVILSLGACKQNSQQTAATIKTTPGKTEEETLKAAYAQYPDSASTLQNLVEYYTYNENYDAALATINKAISRDSLNDTYWDMQSIVAGLKGDTALMINGLQHAIDIIPLPKYIISLGAVFAQTKNPMALRLADALLVANKANAAVEANFIKGLYYSFTNQKDLAIPFYDKCIQLQYTFMDAYIEKALALYDLQQYQKAADVLIKAVTIQNNFDKGYYYLGRCFEKLNKKSDAIEAYQTALFYDPNYIEAQDALGKLGVK
ncbi:tetratricopeptide repeat protein [Ferruginibacter yonginensis]|uniref:Tetratricopeptide repeat protein n=1 Tax=Ferruginibacter yonginensis TaxID=1310416 RepID=A0ABV8QRJ3_9BACT